MVARYLAPVVLVLMLVPIAIYLGLPPSPPTPKDRLKQSLSNLESYSSPSDEFGDLSEFIAGELKQEIEFQALADDLELNNDTTGRLPDSVPGWLFHPNKAAWWQLPKEFDEIYFRGESGQQELLGRTGSKVFYLFYSW